MSTFVIVPGHRLSTGDSAFADAAIRRLTIAVQGERPLLPASNATPDALSTAPDG
jgi:hypothetical protein